jgi:hypothetical protein
VQLDAEAGDADLDRRSGDWRQDLGVRRRRHCDRGAEGGGRDSEGTNGSGAAHHVATSSRSA